MGYINQYHQLKSQFDLNKDEIILDDNNLIIKNFEFQSDANVPSFSSENEDNTIPGNIRFRYPIIMPNAKVKANEAIILLHGLNERTWHKHLTSAKFLAEQSRKPVLMFPLSFHINRGLPEWTDIRKMSGPLNERRKAYPGIREASFVNLALSERLTQHPLRFFLSGLQSMMDLIKLIREIQDGTHPEFDKGTKVNIFAYSISCMLLQSLIISNPGNILKNTKTVLFAGGSLFCYMQGVSKYIMDSVAFDTIRKYYINVFTKNPTFIKEMRPWVFEHSFGKAFRALITPDFLNRTRSKAFANFSENIMVIALRDDRIMPYEGIKAAFGDRFFRPENFRMIHFPYTYTHENPFPVLYDNIDEQVNTGFQSVLTPALNFLS